MNFHRTSRGRRVASLFSAAVLCQLVLSPPTQAAESDSPPADVVPFAGLSATDAAAKASLPDGFKMHVFAAEPDLVQPIAFCLDAKGRIWVAEGITYPKRRGHPPKVESPTTTPTAEQLKDIFAGEDRILVFEDTDGDHKFDKRTVFLDKVNLISGLEVGVGGVWIGAAPYLLFVPVKDWDEPKPAGDPTILLDGWNYSADTHETLNTFTWGPDGWLYGCHGVFCPSNPGKPGTPAAQRQWMDAGVWRYHPTRHVFEVFTEGGSNPWGIDFDENGQLFAEMCVIPHFWHMIHGARIERQGGEHFAVGPTEAALYRKSERKPVHPHIYDDIKQHGDHVHWAGPAGPHAANARSDAVGGGHAHAGVLCYLGLSWPAEYRGKLFLGNIHGQRLNMDIPVRNGSGYVGRHGKDFLNFNDSWSQTLNQRYDQDGSVYIIDWYDKNQCHHTREDGHDRGNGRIYKIVYRDQKVTQVNLRQAGEKELVEQVVSRNEFLSRQARLLLQERAVSQGLSAASTEALKTRLLSGTETAARLRALWTLHLTGRLDARTTIELAKSPDEWLRAWIIQLVFESQAGLEEFIRQAEDQGLKPDPDLNKLAESDRSPLVRSFIASATQRVKDEQFRIGLVKRLLAHAEDGSDHNLPLMYWFAMEPLVATQPEEMLAAALDTTLPKILNFTTRRIALLATAEARNLLTAKLASTDSAGQQLEMLTGLSAAFKGQRNVAKPEGWDALETKLGNSANADVRTLGQTLSLTFGSEKARDSLRQTLNDQKVAASVRRAALDSLVGVKDPELPESLRKLLGDEVMRGPALRALGGYNDSETPQAVLDVYAKLSAVQRRDALSTLVSRAAYARPLLSAVAAKKVPKSDLTADILRQLRSLKDDQVREQLTTLVGAVRESGADKKAEIEKYRGIYRAGGSQPGNASPGRLVFNKVCAQCHTLFDTGGKVGPDITGANRADLNYLLETIIDPNAVIPNEYRTSEIETKDGRSLTGVVKIMDDKTIVLQTANELLSLPRDEIASQRQTELSMMPEGLLAPLTDQEVRDLLYYLSRTGQVPLPVESAAK